MLDEGGRKAYDLRTRTARSPAGANWLYRGPLARRYARFWRRFTERGEAALMSAIDFDRLGERGKGVRVLDIGCGVGTFLARLRRRLPAAELIGMDASMDMLTQAQRRLGRGVALWCGVLRSDASDPLPSTYCRCDLMLLSNVLHYLVDPDQALAGLVGKLRANGQLIVLDYARRPWPFPWTAFEWLVRRIDPGHVRAYTLEEALALCTGAALSVEFAHPFVIDRLWHGWVLRIAAPPNADTSPSPGAQLHASSPE